MTASVFLVVFTAICTTLAFSNVNVRGESSLGGACGADQAMPMFLQTSQTLSGVTERVDNVTNRPVALGKHPDRSAELLRNREVMRLYQVFASVNRQFDQTAVSAALEVVAVGLIGFAIFMACYCSSASAFSSEMTDAIDKFNKQGMGVDVNIGDMYFSPVRGVVMKQIFVSNPPGFSSPFLLRIENATLDTNIFWTGCSTSRRVEIAQALLEGVEILVEDTSNSSNVKQAIQTLRSGAQPQVSGVSFQQFIDTCGRSPQQGHQTQKPQVPLEAASYSIALHEVIVKNIKALYQDTETGKQPVLQQQLKDIRFDDFLHDCGKTNMYDVIKLLVMMVLQDVPERERKPVF